MGVPSSSSVTGKADVNTQIANAVAQMSASEDPQTRALGLQLSQTYGVSSGLSGSKSELSLKDQVKHAAGVVANYANPVLHIINRPGQATLHTLQGFSGQGAHVLDPRTIASAFVAGGKAFAGKEPDINMRQAVLGDDQANNDLGLGLGGLPAGLIDTIGMSAIDPTTYIGGPIAKAGLKGVSKGGQALAATERGAAIADRAAPVTAKLQTIKNAVTPGAALKNAIGDEAGASTKQAIQSSTEDALQQTGDLGNQLNAMIKAAGVTDDELKNVINPAFEAGTAPTLAAEFASKGDAIKADLISSLQRILPKAPAKDYTVFGNTARQIPLELSREGVRAFQKDPEAVANALGVSVKDLGDAVTTGDLSKLGGISLRDVDNKLVDAGVLKAGQQAVSHDVVNLATKAFKKQADNKGNQELLTNTLRDATDNTGQKIVLTDAEKDLAQKRGFVAHTFEDGSKVFVHPQVSRAMREISSVINEDKTVEAFDGALKHLNRLWKGYAVLSPHFHSQNLLGNSFMNAVAGMRNPAYYTRAAAIQKEMGALTKSPEGFEKALKAAKIPEKDKKLIRMIRSEHVADSSFSSAILTNGRKITGKAETATDKAKVAAKKLNPLKEDNAALAGNRQIGSVLEANSRIAHFLWAYEKTGSADKARESVAKYLFDYNSLTPFERKKLQAVVPFYTYLRKNTAVQGKLLAEHPGFYANYGKLQQNLQQNGPDDGTQYDPNRLAQGAFPVQLPGMKNPVLVNPSNPFYAAFGQAQPLGDVAALVPGSPTANKVANPRQELAQNLLAPVGGFTGGVAKVLADEATGKNIATGADIKPGSHLSLIGSTLLPTAGLVQRTTKAAEDGNGATLLNNLAGIPLSQGGQNATNATEAGRLAAVRDALKASEAKGKTKVPTVTQLRKQGKLPKVKKAKAAKKKTVKAKAVKATKSPKPKNS